jgi:hypothetical protein
VLAGLFVGLIVVTISFELPLALTYRRLAGERGLVRVQSLTLLVALVCVVVSRVADFQPGYMYGLVAGYAFVSELKPRDEARAHAITALWMLLVSLAAWLALPAVEDLLGAQPWVQLVVAAVLATVFVAGLEGLLFELVPLRFLRGESVFAWSRPVWALLFGAAAFLFAFILLNPGAEYLGSTRVSPLVPALVLFVAFAVVSVLFWGYFRFREPRPTDEPGDA